MRSTVQLVMVGLIVAVLCVARKRPELEVVLAGVVAPVGKAVLLKVAEVTFTVKAPEPFCTSNWFAALSL